MKVLLTWIFLVTGKNISNKYACSFSKYKVHGLLLWPYNVAHNSFLTREEARSFQLLNYHL